MIFRKILLLLWKNAVLMKRHYIITAFEIILPILCAIALAYVKSKMGGNSYFDETRNPGENTIFPERDERELILQVQQMFQSGYGRPVINYVGFSPKNQQTEQLMQNVIDYINLTIPFDPDTNINVTGFTTEDEMESFYLQLELQDYYKSDDRETRSNFIFGVAFTEGISSGKVGPKVSYKIRMNFIGPTVEKLWYDDFMPGPSFYGENAYYYTGFPGIQLVLDRLIYQEITGEDFAYTHAMQAFPYPPYDDADLKDLFYIVLPVMIVMGFVFIVPNIVRQVVAEKETGIKELMKMAGLSETMHYFGWMLQSLMIHIIAVTIIVIILFVPFSSEAGAIFSNADPTLIWVVLMIYVVWATTFCFVVAAFFERPPLATTFGIMTWIVSFYGLGLAMQEYYGKDFSSGVKLVFSFFPNVAIHLALTTISEWEMEGNGARWTNLTDVVQGSKSIALLYVLLVLLASIVLYGLICLYVEAVMPKKYGVRKPLHFIFKPSEWGCWRKRISMIGSELGATPNKDKPGFEDDPKGIKAGVQIKGLRKVFGGGEKVAVDNLYVNIFEGQIFCLLGENGAGKTTTMSILTGLIPATSGTAVISGYDISTGMDEIRQNLGLCPQHNMLFDRMTVMEHLKFFGVLRGLSFKDAEREGNEMLTLLKIEEKANALSMSLSGGQKRRLSMGCALIGGAKVIFLDEPTSGMDPESRRAIWDILLKIRGDRTIILTTHFMEEADVLGDRIGILASGQLQCCGSTSYLKRFYGAGYTLNMTIENGANRDEILNLVGRHIQGAHLKDTHSNNSTELSIVLPSDSNTTSKFPELFSELEKRRAELRVDDFGIGWTTMDEVFVKAQLTLPAELNDNSLDENDNHLPLPAMPKATGFQLVLSQFYGLLVKKFLYTIRKKRLVLSQMIVPILLTIGAVAISRSVLDSLADKAPPPLKLTLSSYKDPVTVYHSSVNGLGESYAKVVGPSAAPTQPDTSSGLLKAALENIEQFRERYVVAAEINSTHLKAMYSTLALHSAPLSINLLTNAVLRQKGESYNIEVTNHPFYYNVWRLIDETTGNNSDITIIFAMIVAVLLPLGLVLLNSSFLISPMEERLCSGKQLQMMTGVNPFLYWSSSFLVDFFLCLVTVSLMIAFVPALEKDKMFTNNGGAGILFLILIIFCAAAILFSYIFSTFLRTLAGGFAFLTIVHIITGLALGVTSYVLEEDAMNPTSAGLTTLEVVGRLFPTFGVTRAAIDFAFLTTKNGRCETVSEQALEFACDPNLAIDQMPYPPSQACCSNCAELGSECFKTSPYFRWTRRLEKTDWRTGITNYYDVPALTQDLVWLTLIGGVYFCILMLIEYDVFQRLKEKMLKQQESSFNSNVNDNDVLEENERVKTLVQQGQTDKDAMVVENLCKSFGTFSAVSKLSFGVHHGECFGLLGVNGAGKTTTFKMLTGDETRSSGNAFMNNLSLGKGRKEFLSNLGYCPQFDGIIGVLTGMEMLCLYGRLRGVPGNQVELEARKWLKRAGLSKSANVLCAKYSGGMKRRLSAGMALMGEPSVILLDEPTSGVDPVARRQFWKIISSVKNSGQAIILTSHSMEECEALCSRLGIMVNGEMQCFGGVQHLKNKFAQGYTLTVKLSEDLPLQNDPSGINLVIQSIINTFDSCILKDHHQTTLTFHIPVKSSWEDLYRRMEATKAHLGPGQIEEYAITETTLESIFLQFAQKQYVNERVTQGTTLLGISLDNLMCWKRR